jgi:flagellar motility protein MotE (MotC chaperone)
MAQIPAPSDAVWDKLVSGRVTHKFALFAANMALSRAVRLAAADPKQKPALIDELYRFCVKYADELAVELQALR